MSAAKWLQHGPNHPPDKWPHYQWHADIRHKYQCKKTLSLRQTEARMRNQSTCNKSGQDEWGAWLFYMSRRSCSVNTLRWCSCHPACQNYNWDWAEINTCSSQFIIEVPVIIKIAPGGWSVDHTASGTQLPKGQSIKKTVSSLLVTFVFL